MCTIGEKIAHLLRGGDIIVLSEPLGAGKTTFSQGIGRGLKIGEPVVSPTFTIARELNGQFSNGQPAHLVHVDAYRLPGSDNDDAMLAPQQAAHAAANRLLDELESLGLDEILEDPDENTVILMEWGSMMASVLAPGRLEILIDRSLDSSQTLSSQELTSEGTRTITLTAVDGTWEHRLHSLKQDLGREEA
ncbi:tRNA (adenosine(37)-N6)-threonylcarbamoyltransferase complex ATPase subunit type 1 TsaE [Alloscardovia omnicolens]|uniref:tRNA (adenosine(37)-N6)-threonylcarbamoyltransferase complex ATPase subunit type 1 TsaE n=1 Tax=Alloscardovia omnicolens TaxID=419015 RepID=UPI003AF15D58